jgi:hypothetical protein
LRSAVGLCGVLWGTCLSDLQLIEQSMQVTAADPQFFGRPKLITPVHPERGANQLAFKIPNSLMEGASRNLICDSHASKLRRQIFHPKLERSICQDHASFDYVLQLPDIARPVMADKRRQKARGEATRWFVVISRKHFKEELGKQRYVARPLTKRWHVDLHNRNSKVQVFSEGAFLNHLFEIPASRANNPDVYWLGHVGSYALNRALL